MHITPAILSALSRVPLAVSDFRAGIYSIDGVPKTIGEMWMQDPDDGGGHWNAEGDNTKWWPGRVVQGQGIVVAEYESKYSNNPAATPELAAALNLAGGVTMVLHYELIQPDYVNTPEVVVEVADADFWQRQGWVHHSDHHMDFYEQRGGVLADWQADPNNYEVGWAYEQAENPSLVGSFKTTLTMAPDLLAYSINGAAVKQATWGARAAFAATRLWVHVRVVQHDLSHTIICTAILKSIKFYATVTDADTMRAMASPIVAE